MCDNCPSTTPTPKAARRAKHPGNPKVRVFPSDAAAIALQSREHGIPTAKVVRRLMLRAGQWQSLRDEADRLADERDEAHRQLDAERASAAQMADLLAQSEAAARGLAEDRDYHKDRAARCADALHQSESSAASLAEERNRLTARLARLDTLAASIMCDVSKGGSGHTAELPGYPGVRATDASLVVARLEVAVQAANYLPGLVADAMRERDTARSAAEEAAAKLADECQAHAATAAALQIADGNLADAARRIVELELMLAERDARLTSQTWTIGGLGIGLFIALLGLALVVS